MIDFLFRKRTFLVEYDFTGLRLPNPAYVSVKNSFFIRKSEALKDPRFRLDPFNHIRIDICTREFTSLSLRLPLLLFTLGVAPGL